MIVSRSLSNANLSVTPLRRRSLGTGLAGPLVASIFATVTLARQERFGVKESSKTDKSPALMQLFTLTTPAGFASRPRARHEGLLSEIARHLALSVLMMSAAARPGRAQPPDLQPLWKRRTPAGQPTRGQGALVSQRACVGDHAAAIVASARAKYRAFTDVRAELWAS